MNFLRKVSICCLVVFTTFTAVAQKEAESLPAAFKNLVGCWQGTLHYIGTIIRKPYTTTAGLIIKQTSEPSTFQFINVYTPEANENTLDTIIISRDNKKINGESITLTRHTNAGNCEIIIEVEGIDEEYNKPAIFRHTYTLGKNTYIYKKEVKPEGETDWLEREEFKYLREDCK